MDFVKPYRPGGIICDAIRLGYSTVCHKVLLGCSFYAKTFKGLGTQRLDFQDTKSDFPYLILQLCSTSIKKNLYYLQMTLDAGEIESCGTILSIGMLILSYHFNVNQ